MIFHKKCKNKPAFAYYLIKLDEFLHQLGDNELVILSRSENAAPCSGQKGGHLEDPHWQYPI